MSMLERQIVGGSQPTPVLFRPRQQPFVTNCSCINVAVTLHPSTTLARRSTSASKCGNLRAKRNVLTVKATSTISSSERPGGSDSTTEMRAVKAVISVMPTANRIFQDVVSRVQDDLTDLLGKSLLLELLSSEVDPETGRVKPSISAYAHQKLNRVDNNIIYEADFHIPEDFGMVGAILIENEHHKEMFLKDITIIGLDDGAPSFHSPCGSWLHSKYDNPIKRIFFNNKSYLPSETPEGLKEYRETELALMRGFGVQERKNHERIYDYDVYNDLGDPDSDPETKRPVLGGKEHPYPRRCRTGRPRCKTDPDSETRSSNVYVPRDESFSGVKQLSFAFNTVYSVLHAVVPTLQTSFIDSDLPFPFFTAIDKLYNEGINIPELPYRGVMDLFPRLMKAVSDIQNSVICFETPAVLEKDKFSWFRDDEFARQLLAGINPHALRRVTEWPMKSNLDPDIYGSADSLITTELVEKEIKGLTTIKEAMEQNKLYVLDYHDLLIPYVHKVRALKGTTLYGSRTLFLLTEDGTLKVLAIELTRPKSETEPQWRQVFTPGWEATSCWLWKLAKAHVLAHDSGYHQLVSHWLRTHCCTEPYIIATNRQLSAMHPIYRLIDPHFRYTMEINALAREALINADGIIESCFSPGKYAIELSSAAYDLQWQFNTEALPEDLISRGLAVKDETAPHGLKLHITDFPYANDGLLIWDSLKQWISDYVNYYYPDPKLVETDEELQAWWNEIRTEGHGDKKDEPWWPVLKTPEDLIQIVTTMVWVTSGHHAAVNFGQYDFAGYFPSRPTIARRHMPTEYGYESEEWKEFIDKPELALLRTFPSQAQASKVMAILDVLSTHSPDEEYMGEHMEAAWKDDPEIMAAFERFRGRLMEIEGIIDSRNLDPALKNRHGAGVVPYQLLKPFSEPGVTMMGIPYSISI